MKAVLVTGGAGFIASHVADAYINLGLRVVILDNLSTGTRSNLNPKAIFIEGDLGDPKALGAALAEGIDVVNHHAAQVDVRVSVSDPVLDAETNLIGSLRLLQRAFERGVKKVVFASSGGAGYGEPEFYPQTEEHPMRPLSPYGCAKVALEQYLYYYRQIHGVRSVSLRYANVYGPRQRKDGEAGVVAIFGGKLLAGEPVLINGDGRQTRDYIYVQDVVKANLAALDDRIEGPFNVGTGIETSVNELYEMMRSIHGASPDPRFGPAKTGEQMRSVLDGTKLRRVAQLPEPISLRQGLTETMAWLRTQ